MRQLFRELKRRNVYRVAVTYAAVAFVVWQATNLLFPALRFPAWTIDFVIVLTLLSFPVALVIAWAFEVTPEGVQRTADPEGASEPESISPEERRAQSHLAIKALVGLGLIGAAVAGGWYLMGGGGGPPADTAASADTAPTEPRTGDRSVAVLPFENMGGAESEQFTQGVHDGLLTRLSNISDLRVISRTSVMQYAGTGKTVPEIAGELGAQWVVEGAVQQAGGQVQVNAQLIEAREDAHQWAETYRRELNPENLFAIQGELTKKIARSLEAQLSAGEQERVERRPTDDLTAYQLYVQGRHELARRQAGDMEEAVRLFRRAIERDSSFALAWSGLADAAGHEWWGYEGYETLRVTPAEAARRALELDPDLAEAHASMGLVHYRQREGPAALEALHRAVELKPSYAEAHNWLGFTYLVLGRPDAGLQHLELARELNPQHLLARHYLYDAYIMRGEPERALEEIREQQRRYPEWEGPYVAETRALYALGRYEEARAVVREHLLPQQIWSKSYLAGIETALGDTARARQLLADLQQEDRLPRVMAYAHAAFGDVDATLSAWQKVEDWSYVPTFTLRYVSFPEGMSRIRDDPRYGELLRQVNAFWGLNPDGSLPDSVDVSFSSEADE